MLIIAVQVSSFINFQNTSELWILLLWLTKINEIDLCVLYGYALSVSPCEMYQCFFWILLWDLQDTLHLISSSWTCPIEMKLSALFWLGYVNGGWQKYAPLICLFVRLWMFTKYQITRVLTSLCTVFLLAGWHAFKRASQ